MVRNGQKGRAHERLEEGAGLTISQQQLGERLRAAREACRLTQDDVARHLGVSRPTVTQIELGNRAVSSIELDMLAYLYGRDIRDFLADEFEEADALVALFRRHPEVSEDEGLLAPLRECLALGREITILERLLGVDRDLTALPSYAVPVPSAKWTSVEQGDRLASEERSRLGLGAAPLPNLAELLETQGVRTAQVHLADDVSGCTLFSPDVGVFVLVNRRHHFFRRRFSFAHEYSHVVLDREQEGTVSRASDRDDLIEVRTNSFAASFLMPETGVVEFIRGLSKGRPGRERAEIFDEEVAVAAEGRTSAGNQALQLYDVVLLADHFGVSRSAALIGFSI